MPKYKNLNGDSSVRSYTINYNNPPPQKGRAKNLPKVRPTPIAINVTFHNGQTYQYTTQSCGESALNTMIILAEQGAGLNSYIKRNHVSYSKKA